MLLPLKKILKLSTYYDIAIFTSVQNSDVFVDYLLCSEQHSQPPIGYKGEQITGKKNTKQIIWNQALGAGNSMIGEDGGKAD